MLSIEQAAMISQTHRSMGSMDSSGCCRCPSHSSNYINPCYKALREANEGNGRSNEKGD